MEPELTWTEGDVWRRYANEKKVLSAVEAFVWAPITKPIAMSPGLAVNLLIKEFELPARHLNRWGYSSEVIEYDDGSWETPQATLIGVEVRCLENKALQLFSLDLGGGLVTCLSVYTDRDPE